MPTRNSKPETRNVLITGWTGLLGSKLVEELHARSIHCCLGSRREPTDAALKVKWRQLDLDKPGTFEAALEGIHTIFHLASQTKKFSYRTDVEGTQRLLEACKQAGVKHFIYMSIVGIEKVPVKYYRFKREAELAVMHSGLPFTILRATQFYEYLKQEVEKYQKLPLPFVPKDILYQPIRVERVAHHLANLLDQSPANEIIEIGGPEVLSLGEATKDWMKARGQKNKFMINIPLVLLGKLGKALRDGGLTTKAVDKEGMRWKDWVKVKSEK